MTKNTRRIAGLPNRRRPCEKTVNDIRLHTWNVRTLYRPAAFKELLQVLEQYRVDVIALQEIRWLGSKIIEQRDYTMLYSCHDKHHELGTGFIVTKRMKHLIMDFKSISPRLCYLRIRGKFFNYSIINAHAPTEEAPESDKDVFYDELEKVRRKCPRHDIKMLVGDLNAKVGREKQYLPTIGKYSLHEESNDNGVRLISWAAAADMVIKSTCFPHKNIHKGTWKTPNGNNVNQIDHVIIDSRHYSDIMDIRSRRGANIDSDHYLVECKLRARIANVQKKKSSQKSPRYNTEFLKNEEKRIIFQTQLTKEFEIKQLHNMKDDIDRYWNTFNGLIHKVLNETLGLREQTKYNNNLNWFDEECEVITTEKNEAYKKMQQKQNTRNATENYKVLRRKEKKVHRKKKKEFMEIQLKELEIDRKMNTRKFYQNLNHSRKEHTPNPGMCRDKDGTIISEKDRILRRWVEVFNGTLNDDRISETDKIVEQNKRNIDVDIPTEEEVIEAIGRLKNNKAAGVDGIVAEVYKNGGEHLSKYMTQLLESIWSQRKIPKMWRSGIVVPIYKKGDQLNCENYRGITLLNIAYKILASILQKRLQPYAENIIGKYQCGFSKHKSTVDQIFILRQVLEKTGEYNIATHHMFIDFRSAYDSVNREQLYAAMREFGIPGHLVNMVCETLTDVECCIRIQNEISEPFSSTIGLRQGDPLSCLLFNIALEKVFRETGISTRYSILNGPHQILAYADDVCIMSRTKEGMINIFTKLEAAAKKMGLCINAQKTSYMYVPTRKIGIPATPAGVQINQYYIDGVADFVYLGSQFNNNNTCSNEIKRRLYLANRAYCGLKKQLHSQFISRGTKCLIYKVLIRPVLMYGSETWVLSKEDESLLGRFERRILRSIFKGICVDGLWRRRYNFEMYQLYTDPDIVRMIKINRLRWIGHIERMPESDPTKKALTQQPLGKRTAGRPRSRYLDQVESDIKSLKIKNWKAVARNRTEWKKLLVSARTHKGLSSQL